MTTSSSNHYVIAGGTGLIGRALTRHWLAAGREVVVFSRRSASAVVAGARVVVWGVDTPSASWLREIEGAHAVVNLCGENIGGGRWTASRKRALIESRTHSTRALADATRTAARPPKVFVQASGVGYYGTGEAVFNESSPAGTDFLASLSRDWEGAASAVSPSVRLVLARFGVVLDANEGAFPRLALPVRLGVGGPIAGGRQWLSWIHLDDAAAAIEFAVDNDDLAGPVNVTAPNPIRNAEVARVLGRVLHRPAIVPVPRLALRLLLGEQATLVCDGQRAMPEKLRAAGFEYRYPTFELAARALLK